MAGQGTAALELIEDGGELDVLLVPVGGGGLIAGCSTAATALCPSCVVVGVEPEVGDDTRRSLAAGERVRVPVGRTIADGQQLDIPGQRTFPVVQERVAAVETVSDAEIVDAMRFAFERLKLVLEPSGASALAALLAGRVDAAGRRVGVILSGGNVDVARFRELTAREAPPRRHRRPSVAELLRRAVMATMPQKRAPQQRRGGAAARRGRRAHHDHRGGPPRRRAGPGARTPVGRHRRPGRAVAAAAGRALAGAIERFDAGLRDPWQDD